MDQGEKLWAVLGYKWGTAVVYTPTEQVHTLFLKPYGAEMDVEEMALTSSELSD